MFKHRFVAMEIEKAIKQSKPFDDIYQKASVNLMYTHNIITGDFHRFFKKFGMTTKQYNILRIVNGAGKPVSTSFIKERLLDRNSDVSRIVDRMESKSIVKKTTCETDKRLVDVDITVKGQNLLQAISFEMDAMESVFKKLTKTEVETLNNLLDKLRQK